MKAFIVTFLVTLALDLASAAKIVCYYQSNAVYHGNNGEVQPEDLDPNLCTHINYYYASIFLNGTVHVVDEFVDTRLKVYERVVKLKEQNPKLEVLLSISASASNFSAVAADKELRKNLVTSARKFMTTFGFDGIDLDWEFPGRKDLDNFVALLQDLRDDFNKNGGTLSAAVSAEVQDGYDVAKLFKIVDHVNVLTFDMYGSWSKYTGQNAPLYASSVETSWEQENLNMNVSILQWIAAGANATKLLPGIAFYGNTFTLADATKTTLHSPITGAGVGGPFMRKEGVWSYVEVCHSRGSWHCQWDGEQKTQICVNGKQWLGINNDGSMRSKAGFIKSHHLGGVAIWSVEQDDVHGSCGDANILLNAIVDNLPK